MRPDEMRLERRQVDLDDAGEVLQRVALDFGIGGQSSVRFAARSASAARSVARR